ncbi:MAG: hypothetical protein JW967_08565, partial [Dehalococcoidales bacterium]|nr:hypothetical protein [Dehalococcoidales bacterium]
SVRDKADIIGVFLQDRLQLKAEDGDFLVETDERTGEGEVVPIFVTEQGAGVIAVLDGVAVTDGGATLAGLNIRHKTSKTNSKT